MDRRRSPRVGANLPVRVWGVDAHDLPFMQLASVKNLSGSGAVIHGMRRQMRPGKSSKCRWTRIKRSSGWYGQACPARAQLGRLAYRGWPPSLVSGLWR